MIKKPEARTAGLQSITGFFSDVRSELMKAQWPTREQTIKLTALVIVITLATGLFLGLFDALFYQLLNWMRSVI